MDDREYRSLLQQRSALIESLNAKKSSVKTYNDYIDKAEQNILKNKMLLRDTRMEQIISEIDIKIKALNSGIETSKKEIEKITKEISAEQERFDDVCKLIEKQKKILAGEYYDEETMAKEIKIYNKFKK